MRIATLILGLFLAVVILLQSCVAFGLTRVGESLGVEQTETEKDRAQAASLGVLGGILALLGAAFALGKPYVACAAFALGWIVSLFGAGEGFPDLRIWAWAQFALAWMALGSGRTRRTVPAAGDPSR